VNTAAETFVLAPSLLLLTQLQVKERQELEFLKGRAETIDEMEAMLPLHKLQAINKAMLPYLLFLLPVDAVAEQQQELQPATTVDGDNSRADVGAMKALLAEMLEECKSREEQQPEAVATAAAASTDAKKGADDLAALKGMLAGVLEQCRSSKQEQQQQAELLRQLQPSGVQPGAAGSGST
jgi:hypothetical protein